MNLVDFLFETKDPDKESVYFNGVHYTRKDIYGKILFTAGKIRSRIRHGERVGLVADNSVFFIASYLGIIEAGGVCVPLYPGSGKDYLRDTLTRSGARIVFAEEKHLNKIEGFDILTEKDIEGHSDKKHASGEIDDCALILFTSGSTAKPKGVMLSNKNLICNTRSIVDYLRLDGHNRILATLPFSYTFGLSWANASLRAGEKLVIDNKLVPAGKILTMINKYKCTSFSGVPATFQLLLRTTDMKKMRFPTLRFVTQAGGKLQDALIKELIDALPNVDIFIMYGQTEASPRLSYLPPERLKDKLGSIGKGIPGTKLEVLNESGYPVRPGELGEIVATGDNIMLGYMDSPEETEKVLRNGKLHTGDIATVDADGFIYIADRAKNLIKARGFRISPAEIENIILQMPDIIEAMISGLPDELAGESIKADIVSKNPQITDKEIIDHCRKFLPPYKIPSKINFVQEISKTPYGKPVKIAPGDIYG